MSHTDTFGTGYMFVCFPCKKRVNSPLLLRVQAFVYKLHLNGDKAFLRINYQLLQILLWHFAARSKLNTILERPGRLNGSHG